MQEAVPAGEGAMAALLGLEAEEVAALCEQAVDQVGGLVSPANFNGGGQVVIAGTKTAVEAAIVLARSRGARRAVPLAVSAPFHCDLMKPAADRMAEAMDGVTIHPFRIPVISNVDAEPNVERGRGKDLLVRQVTAPVRFEECVRCLRAGGVGEAVELGHGRVLSGLVKRVVADIKLRNVGAPEDIDAWTT
jgi:[acyl-carrier-protein] S-malonyltransferase